MIPTLRFPRNNLQTTSSAKSRGRHVAAIKKSCSVAAEAPPVSKTNNHQQRRRNGKIFAISIITTTLFLCLMVYYCIIFHHLIFFKDNSSKEAQQSMLQHSNYYGNSNNNRKHTLSISSLFSNRHVDEALLQNGPTRQRQLPIVDGHVQINVPQRLFKLVNKRRNKNVASNAAVTTKESAGGKQADNVGATIYNKNIDILTQRKMILFDQKNSDNVIGAKERQVVADSATPNKARTRIVYKQEQGVEANAPPPPTTIRTTQFDFQKNMFNYQFIPLLIITANRAQYLEHTLDLVYNYHPMNPSSPYNYIYFNETIMMMLKQNMSLVFDNNNKKQSAFTTEKKKKYMCGMPIIISQDGTNELVSLVITKYQKKFQELNVPVHHTSFIEIADNVPNTVGAADFSGGDNNHNLLRGNKNNKVAKDPHAAYRKLARHYKQALINAFDNTEYYYNYSNEIPPPEIREMTEMMLDRKKNESRPPSTDTPPEAVIILEEDLSIAPDFFEYMSAMAPFLLNNQPQSWPSSSSSANNAFMAISAFNDNGQINMVRNTTRGATHVLRTEFFGGLGWMMPRFLWDEVRDKWPPGYWDDWLRDDAQRRGRDFIRPEISRTFHTGQKGGASNNWFGKNLERILLNSIPVRWPDVSVAEQLDKVTHDKVLLQRIEAASSVQNTREALSKVNTEDVRLEYSSIAKDFSSTATKLGIMSDEKAGVPRTAYKGVVQIWPNGGEHCLFLIPRLVEVQKALLLQEPLKQNSLPIVR